MTFTTRRYSKPRRVATAILAAGSILALSACHSASNAAGGGTWHLNANDWNPEGHPFIESGWKPLAEALEERTGGRVTLDYFASEGLGAVSETPTLLTTRQADMASSIVAYHSDILPSAQVTVPAGWESAELGSQAMWELCQQEPFKSEFEAAKLVPIACFSVSMNELYLSKDRIDSIPAAFAGKRLSATGLRQQIVQKMGATSIDDTSTEMYLRLEQGSADGVVAPKYGLTALSYNEVTNAMTDGMDSWNSGMVFFALSADLWNEFPEDIKQVFRELGPEIALEVGKGVDQQDADAMTASEGIVDVYEVSDEERAKVQEAVRAVREDWVTTMEANGQGEKARQAVAALESVEDIEPEPIDEWTPLAY